MTPAYRSGTVSIMAEIELAPLSHRLDDDEVKLLAKRLKELGVAEFERGVKLLRTCYRVLEEAEQKIELLVGFDAQGEPVTEPFDATATYDAKAQTVGRRRTARKSAAKPPPEAEPEDDSETGGLF